MRNKKVKNMAKVKRKRKPIKKPKKPLAKKMAIAGIGGLAALGVWGKTGARVVPPPVARVRVVMPAKEIEKEKLEVKEKEVVPSFQTYTVEKGDSLWKIAQSAYGRGERWIDIWMANRASLQEPNLIFEGQALKIPQEKLHRASLPVLPVSAPAAPERTQQAEAARKNITAVAQSLERISETVAALATSLQAQAQAEALPQLRANVEEARRYAVQAQSITNLDIPAIDLATRVLDTARETLLLTQTVPTGTPSIVGGAAGPVITTTPTTAVAAMDGLVLSQTTGSAVAAGEAQLPAQQEVQLSAAAQALLDAATSTVVSGGTTTLSPNVTAAAYAIGSSVVISAIQEGIAGTAQATPLSAPSLSASLPPSPSVIEIWQQAVFAGAEAATVAAAEGVGSPAAVSAASDAAAAAATAADASASAVASGETGAVAAAAGAVAAAAGANAAAPGSVTAANASNDAAATMSDVSSTVGNDPGTAAAVAATAAQAAVAAAGIAAVNAATANATAPGSQAASIASQAVANASAQASIAGNQAGIAGNAAAQGNVTAAANAAVAAVTASMSAMANMNTAITASQAAQGNQAALASLNTTIANQAAMQAAFNAVFGLRSGGEEATPSETAPPSEISETGLGIPGLPSVPGEEGNVGPTGEGAGVGAPAGEGVGSGTSTGEGDAAGAVSGPAAATGEGPAGGGSGDSGSGDGGSGPGSAGDGVGSIFIMKATSQATGLPLGVITEPVKQMADALNQQHPGASDLVVPEYRMRASTLIETIARRPDWQQVYQWIAQNIGDPVRKAMAKGDIGGAAQAFRTGFETAERRYLGTGTHPPDPNAPRPAHVGADGLMSQWAAQEAIRQAKKFRGLPYEVGGNGSI